MDERITAKDLISLGKKRGRAGDLASAEQCYLQVLQHDQNNIEALYHLGVNSFHGNKTNEAIHALKKVLELRPDQAETFNYLGMSFQRQGLHREALDCYQQACQLKPELAQAQFNLGQGLLLGRNVQAAEHCLRESIRLQPEFFMAHCRLGELLLLQDRLDEAVECWQTAVSLDPNSAPSYRNLGEALFKQGNLNEAEAAFRKAIDLQPQTAEYHFLRAEAVRYQGELPFAENIYRQAIQLNPKYDKAFNNLGTMLLLQEHRLEEAVACFEEVLKLMPDDLPAHCNLGSAYLTTGNRAKSIAHFKEALRIDPDNVEALSSAAANDLFPLSDMQLNTLAQKLRTGKLPADDQCMVCFALAKSKNTAGQYDEAFELYQQGNAIRKQMFAASNTAFDPVDFRDQIDGLIETYTADYFKQVADYGLDTEVPVFIVGMPRSGTSLVEQMLACHPHVFGGGELMLMGPISQNLSSGSVTGGSYPECMPHVSQSQVLEQAQQHLDKLNRLGNPATRVIDKMPINFMHLGMIATLFPQARVLHCLRDPVDTCLSCYFQRFRDLNFAWDLGELGLFYREYQRLMKHWRKVLPIQMMDVCYEELVSNQEQVCRGMVDFLGLEWDESCLAFHENHRPVLTASKLQVREPVYSSSVGRWKKYEAHLKPLIDALAESAD